MSVRCVRCGPESQKTSCDHACSCPPDCPDGLPCDMHGFPPLRATTRRAAPFVAPDGKHVIVDLDAYVSMLFAVGAIQVLCEERGIFTRDEFDEQVIWAIDNLAADDDQKTRLKEAALDMRRQ